METAQKEFINVLVGSVALQEEFERTANVKQAKLATALEVLTPENKETIRAGLTFDLVDKKGKKKVSSFSPKGQEHAADTFEATARGWGLTDKDYQAAMKSWGQVVDLVCKLRDQKDKNGEPLFTPDEIADEALTPMVREGLIPENLVPNLYSEVQKLLNATFSAYKTTLKEADEEKDQKAAELEAKFHGAGSKLDMVLGLKGKVDQRKGMIMNQMGLTDKRMRRLELGVEGIKTGIAIGKAGVAVNNLASGKAFEKAEGFLNPDASKLSPEGREALGSGISDPDLVRCALAQEKRSGKWSDLLGSVGEALKPLGLSRPEMEKVAENLAKLVDTTEETWASNVSSSITLTKGLLSTAITGALDGKAASDAKKVIDAAQFEYAAREAAEKAVTGIDDVLVVSLAKVNALAGVAFEGLFEKEVDQKGLVEATAPNTDAGAVIKTIADGLQAAFSAATPDPMDSTFASAGGSVAKLFRSSASSSDLAKAIADEPAKAFEPIIAAVANAVAKGVPSEFKDYISDPQRVRDMAGKSVFPDEEEALEELERSEDEIREYERQLVLIDEGGISAAETRSIEKLIKQLERDRQILQMVATLGGGLTDAGGTVVSIVANSTEKLTEEVASQILGPLKAAKLILQLAINTKKAADRWALWYKFMTDLGRARKAVSAMSSTIEGFFNNKNEQITFHTIEDALLAVEIAATIVGSVPHPITIAVGKTMGAVTAACQQANKFAGMAYNEKMLTDAWNTTKEAMNNPSNRKLGLKALRLNPTLGMHALAWAGLEKQPPDPIARMVLSSLGLTEQTLMVSGTEKKVREYLETLLNEDRQIVDPAMIKTDWAPAKLTLAPKDWFVVTSRGSRDATPKLRLGPEKPVFEALKKVELHPLKALDASAKVGGADPADLEQKLKEIELVRAALMKYQPVDLSNAPHEDMANIVAEFLSMANDHREKLSSIQAKNNAARDPKRAIYDLNQHLGFFELLLDESEEDLVAKADRKMLEKLRDEANDDLDRITQVNSLITAKDPESVKVQETIRDLMQALGQLEDRMKKAG